MNRFIKFNPDSDTFLSMVAQGYHKEVILLSVMATRARRTNCTVTGLNPGECFLGDFAALGLSERQYRTAKKNLEKFGLATFKATNKGTVGKLANTEIYDINEFESDRQATSKRQASDRQATTNKNVKNVKKEKNDYTVEFDQFWKVYPRKEKKSEALKAFQKISPDQDLLDRIISDVQARAQTHDWTKENGKYVPHPTTYLNQQRWEDEAPASNVTPMKRKDGAVRDEHGEIKGWWMFGGTEFVQNPQYRRPA